MKVLVGDEAEDFHVHEGVVTRSSDFFLKAINSGFEETNGVDDIGAIVTYADVGGKFDGEPTQATLYYVDGAWRLYSIGPA